jgi:hypothetical protein
VEVGDSLVDALGVFVSGLATTAGLVGLGGEGAVAAGQDGGGVADPGKDG